MSPGFCGLGFGATPWPPVPSPENITLLTVAVVVVVVVMNVVIGGIVVVASFSRRSHAGGAGMWKMLLQHPKP